MDATPPGQRRNKTVGRMKIHNRTVRGYKFKPNMLAGLMTKEQSYRLAIIQR
jgi:hypothetical protein